jgi:hypothetical protein
VSVLRSKNDDHHFIYFSVFEDVLPFFPWIIFLDIVKFRSFYASDYGYEGEKKYCAVISSKELFADILRCLANCGRLLTLAL